MIRWEQIWRIWAQSEFLGSKLILNESTYLQVQEIHSVDSPPRHSAVAPPIPPRTFLCARTQAARMNAIGYAYKWRSLPESQTRQRDRFPGWARVSPRPVRLFVSVSGFVIAGTAIGPRVQSRPPRRRDSWSDSVPSCLAPVPPTQLQRQAKRWRKTYQKKIWKIHFIWNHKKNFKERNYFSCRRISESVFGESLKRTKEPPIHQSSHTNPLWVLTNISHVTMFEKLSILIGKANSVFEIFEKFLRNFVNIFEKILKNFWKILKNFGKTFEKFWKILWKVFGKFSKIFLGKKYKEVWWGQTEFLDHTLEPTEEGELNSQNTAERKK